MTGALVGIDVGTSGVKGVAIDDRGEVLALSEAHYRLATPRPGWAEQDPEDWWTAAAAVLAQLHAASGEPTAIGLSGQMHGLVALDRRDRVIRPAILWNDQRSARECEEIERTVGFERLIELTGNRAFAGFTAPKLLWLRRHEPQSYERIARIALPKDYVRLRLCGEHLTDVSDASGTLLFDVRNRRWSEEMLAALELEPAWLPPALEGPDVSGTTDSGVPVAAGGGDQAAGAVGVGADRPGPASVVLGSSGVVFAALEQFAADARGRVHAFCHAVPGAWHAMGVMLSAAAALSWFREVAGEPPYGQLLEGAALWPAGVEGLLFLPYLAGERTPHADADARGAFIGLELRHDTGALARAVMEGVAFGLRDSLDLLSKLDAEISIARVSGGGARSGLWLRIVASVLELPLERVAVDEGAAFGAAVLAGVAAGVWPDVQAGVEATVRVSDTVEPVPEWVAVYSERRERFRELYPALRR
ncbi:MAG TPA: xylulokinase [Solirubrobacteraceae bacterium]|nr:xylulokinase [Solirubrobacteraceae bacterium]